MAERLNNNESSRVLVPGWVRHEIKKLLDSMGGEHAEVLVASVALLGPDGFDLKTVEQTPNFDPNEYGPIMLQGVSLTAGAYLAKAMDTVYAATQYENHFTKEIESEEERMQAMRNLYEQCIRMFIKHMLETAGIYFQEKPEHDMSVAAGSQLLALWIKVAESTIVFKTPDEEEEDDG